MRKEKVERQQVKVKSNWRLALLIFAFCLLTFSFACGRRRPPQPPVERVPQRTELLSGVQRGNLVILSWPAPLRNAPDGSVQSIRRIDVYRFAEPVNAPFTLTEEEFAARATLVGSVPFDAIQASEGTITYTDELRLSEPVRLRYAVRYVNAANQRAAFSNFLLVEPAASVSRPPVLSSEVGRSDTSITVRWESPKSNIDDTTPPNLLGYNVYRATRTQNESAETPLNGPRPLPPSQTQFVDQNFQFGEEYVYIVRAASLGTDGNPVESLNSNPVVVAARDEFPPTPPKGISTAATENRISLFWAANPERDVVGYNLFRSNDPAQPKESWTKLNRALLTRTTFQDDSVRSGVRYFYYLTAVDNAGNVSLPSEVVSETAP